MSRTPWYRWFPSDFGGSIKVKAMSDLAELVYRRLLDALWESKDCLLPEDLPFLHNVLLPKRPFSEFEAVWSELTRPGFEVITRPVEGMISNRRISCELEDTRALIEKKRAAGKIGAQKRWGVELEPEPDGNGIAPAMAPAMAEGIANTWQEGSHPHPHPHPQLKPKKRSAAGASGPSKEKQVKPKLKPVPKVKPDRVHYSKAISGGPGLVEAIDNACQTSSALKFQTKSPWNPWQWVQYQANQNTHPQAILEALSEINKRHATITNGPWSYANTIVKTRSQNYREAEFVAEAQAFARDMDRAGGDLQKLRELARGIG
jgi:hypothetical protein